MGDVYAQIKGEIAERQGNGQNIDPRLLETIRRHEKSRVQVIEINDSCEFLRLLFHVNDGSILLTPPGQPRSLMDCVARMQAKHLSFDGLAGSHPNYFKKCLPIYEKFDFTKFYSIFLLDLTQPERECTPKANFSIYDGTHKTLVLAYKILVENFEFHSVRTFVFKDRDRVVL